MGEPQLTYEPELLLLAKLARAVPFSQCVVELGVFRGGSLKVLSEATSSPTYGVDLWGGDGTPQYYDADEGWIAWWESKTGARHSWEDDFEAARAAAPKASLIRGDTAKVGDSWDREPVGLLYVDGDHSYEGVKRDWVAWKDSLTDGAAVVFDDYRHVVRKKDHYPGVTRLVDEIGGPTFTVGKAAVILL